MSKRVLLLGGTGAIGVYLAPELLSRGFEVDITTRSSRASEKKNLKYIKGNAHDTEFLTKVLGLRRYDAIVDFMNYPTNEFRAKHKNLLKSCKHYIFLSSYRVFAEEDVITEKSPRLLDVSGDVAFLQNDDYSLAKARQEDILRDSAYTNWTIVRPAITYSTARFQLGTLEADMVVWRTLQKLPVALPKEMLYKKTTMTWAGDVARLIAKLIFNKKAYGEDYNIATSENHTWAEVVDIYRRNIGLSVKVVSIKQYVAAMGGGSNYYQVKYDRMYDRILDNTKILRATGEEQKSFTKLRDGLQHELTKFIKEPHFGGIDYAKQARFDKLTHTKIDLSSANPNERRLYEETYSPQITKIKRSLRPRTRIYNILLRTKQFIRLRNRARSLIAAVMALLTNAKFKRADGAILTLTGYFNYGNVLQRYALQKFLKKNGHNFVSYVDPYSAPRDIYRIGRKKKLKTPLRAIKRYFNYQKPYWYMPKYGDIYPDAHGSENLINFVNKNIWIKSFDPNDNYKNYIVGSDQIWRNWWSNREILGYYFLNYLNGRQANRIAYAASFGMDKIEEVMSQEDAEYVRPYIEGFANISVREKSAVDMIKKTWGIANIDEVVDPTMLLSAADYSGLVDNSDVRYEKIQPIFTYILGETVGLKDFIRKVQDERQQSVTSVRAHDGEENDILPPVELWLKGFRDAELVVTNSYHGMIFSVINNTDFIVIGREVGGLSRIRDFLLQYGLAERFTDEANLASFDRSKLKPIDWNSVNKTLKQRRKESAEWLLYALAQPKV